MSDQPKPRECMPILARIAAEAAKLGLVEPSDAPSCTWPEGATPKPVVDEPQPAAPVKAADPEEQEPWWNK